MLQALKEEPPLSTKCKDKFLIQSTIITPDKETLPLSDIVCIPSVITRHLVSTQLSILSTVVKFRLQRGGQGLSTETARYLFAGRGASTR